MFTDIPNSPFTDSKWVTQGHPNGQWFPEITLFFLLGCSITSRLDPGVSTMLWVALSLDSLAWFCFTFEGRRRRLCSWRWWEWVNCFSFLKVHWLNSKISLPTAGCLFVDIKSDFKWQFLSLMMGWKQGEKLKEEAEFQCQANDLLTLNPTRTRCCLWWRKVIGNTGEGENYECSVICVLQSYVMNNAATRS